jgi:hypothetical protein
MTDALRRLSRRGTITYERTDTPIDTTRPESEVFGRDLNPPLVAPRRRRVPSIYIHRLPDSVYVTQQFPTVIQHQVCQPQPIQTQEDIDKELRRKELKERRSSKVYSTVKLASQDSVKRLLNVIFPTTSKPSDGTPTNISRASSPFPAPLEARSISPDSGLLPAVNTGMASTPSQRSSIATASSLQSSGSSNLNLSTTTAATSARSSQHGLAPYPYPEAGGRSSPHLSSANVSSTPNIATTPFPQIPTDQKAVTGAGGVTVYITLAEPFLFLYGSRDQDIHNRSTAMLRGSLLLRIEKPTKLKAINLTFRGKTRTDWPEGKIHSFSNKFSCVLLYELNVADHRRF